MLCPFKAQNLCFCSSSRNGGIPFANKANFVNDDSSTEMWLWQFQALWALIWVIIICSRGYLLRISGLPVLQKAVLVISFKWGLDAQCFCFVLVQRLCRRPQLKYVTGDTRHMLEYHGPTCWKRESWTTSLENCGYTATFRFKFRKAQKMVQSVKVCLQL